MLTTLIAAWIKKQNYVDRIKSLDRYIQKLSKLNIEIESVLTKSPWDRVNYNKFIEMYEPQIVHWCHHPHQWLPKSSKRLYGNLPDSIPNLFKTLILGMIKIETGSYIMTDLG